MASQQSSLLVDTNVWLDCFLPNRPGHDEAIALVLFAYEHEYPLLYPAAILKDVFYLTANAFKRDTRNETGKLNQRDAIASRKARGYRWHRTGSFDSGLRPPLRMTG